MKNIIPPLPLSILMVFIINLSFNTNEIYAEVAKPTTLPDLGFPKAFEIYNFNSEFRRLTETQTSKPIKRKIKVLIVDGQNNHAAWPKSTIMMKQYLEETGLFIVDILRTQYLWKADREKEFLSLAGVGEKENMENPEEDPEFAPKFHKYDVVVSNFGWKAAAWPNETQAAFEKFIKKGGGFVAVHAANNSFPNWEEYNKMIGLGGWGDRDEKDGPYVYYTDNGQQVRDISKGKAGAHGPQHSFPITIRDSDHPITHGMPKVWLTAKNECYAKLRGPAENMVILATGKDVSGKAPTNRHEPVFMVINYRKGRIFNTILGHDIPSFEGVGFIVSFTRGVEWAATGKVTQAIPKDFPKASKSKSRTFHYEY
ncbi:Type 1 glutamine amidotransferase (GATase1) [Salegentibacter agarivorans]|uniref:Type 1 glutamine amidotransferase (GATase1) n=1 Tax=Salegentibacter agarivorans TaxID=345907 RepID=A0A1I2KM31_9FLAO|nr:ThuA domain-containing protein [Salegentibacter agarivorans]SFF68044.1 Type 1 glutamine amidotransferase (GATase1) [Salegentibacter agarivorans]